MLAGKMLKPAAAALGGVLLGASTMSAWNESGKVPPIARKEWPLISYEELQKHTDMDSLWVVYNGHILDITDFMFGHPGGTDRLLMAGGLDLGPFWDIYTEHYRGHVIPFALKTFKIGELNAEDAARCKDFVFDDPYEDDPIRHPDLLHCTTHPFNGECRLERLTENYYTPNELHYCRLHLPVPTDLEDDEWELIVQGNGITDPKTYSLEDVKSKFKKYEVVNCYQCAGNRRDDFHGSDGGDQLIFISPHWVVGAISNAKWGGARMRDVLADCGLDVDNMTLGKVDPFDVGAVHVCFEGYDHSETGIYYGSSVPIDKVLDPHGGCLVAYEMNGEPVPWDHGRPARAMIPGHAGCRSTKFLHSITLSATESTKPWQNKSYLGFAPDCRFEGDPDKNPGKVLWKWYKDPVMKAYIDYQQNATYGHLGRAIVQIQPVTSMICNPPQHSVLAGLVEEVEIKGVAHSFGGSGINRVDVSINGGETWTAADIFKPEDVLRSERFGKMFGWTLFTKKVPLTQEKDDLAAGRRLQLELVSKGVDTHFNVQPEYPESYYNPRGVCIGHMYRVPLIVEPNVQRAKATQSSLKMAYDSYYKPDPKVTPAGATGQEFPNKPTGGIFLEPWLHNDKGLEL
jgi:sulfite oxidase